MGSKEEEISLQKNRMYEIHSLHMSNMYEQCFHFTFLLLAFTHANGRCLAQHGETDDVLALAINRRKTGNPPCPSDSPLVASWFSALNQLCFGNSQLTSLSCNIAVPLYIRLMFVHLKPYCNWAVPWKYLSLSEHPVGIAKVTATAEHPTARFHWRKGPSMHHPPSPHRGSGKVGPVPPFRGWGQVVPSFLLAGRWLKAFSPRKRRKKRVITTPRKFPETSQKLRQVF